MTLLSPILSDRRVLAGLRFRDGPTAETVRRPLILSHPRLGFTRNRSGLYAVTGLRPDGALEEALAEHLSVFVAAPDQPSPESVTFSVSVNDPESRYIPRIFALALPRGDAWADALSVDLAPSPVAPVGSNWSGVRATLTQGPDRTPLAGARLRILRDSDGELLGQGYSDQRGEVLAVVVGLPVVDFTTTPPSNGASQSLGAKTVTTRIEIHTGPGESWPPFPEAIDADGQAWAPVAGALPNPELRTGRLETANLALHLQPQP